MEDRVSRSLLQGHVARKVAVVEDRLCIVDVEKAVSPCRCILQTGGLGI